MRRRHQCILVETTRLTTATDRQIQVAITVSVAPGNVGRSVRFAGLPHLDQSWAAGLTAQVSIDNIGSIRPPHGQLRIAVVVPIPPGQAGRLAIGHAGGPDGSSRKHARHIFPHSIVGAIIAHGQIQIIVPIVIGPSHFLRRLASRIFPGQVKTGVTKVAIDVGLSILKAGGEIQVAIAVIVTHGYAVNLAVSFNGVGKGRD